MLEDILGMSKLIVLIAPIKPFPYFFPTLAINLDNDLKP